MSGEWTVIESTDGKPAMEEEEEAVTDICLLTKKEKVPSGYTVVRRERTSHISLLRERSRYVSLATCLADRHHH